MASEITLKDLFSGLQKQMVLRLNINKRVIKHPVSVGDSIEIAWIKWLNEYLPKRYKVDKAFVIDSTGQISEQIDLVIYDRQYTPFIFTQDGTNYIPAEGVYAVFEIKSNLHGKSEIDAAGKKVASVRRLKRTSTFIIDKGKKYPARGLTPIIGGLLTHTSDPRQKTIENNLKKLKGNNSLDICCSVVEGTFMINYKSQELSDSKATNWVDDYYQNRILNSIEFSGAETSLVTFFFHLMQTLQQRIGTIAAIDLGEYLKRVNEN